ncbi:glycosyltransferase [Filimonas effusa]|uniref:Glycosyltransferase n=1 Tax=Filimonas effusa TaxID=2508721 RepID=A0A4Q1DDZ4_9BACT|nr:glycosyltransferase [Filimonas effusa]RXK86809.1 glycosyltransferase [Filimonas effusa]
MTIAVISMIRTPWGGSEELWYEMAKAALAKGIKLVHLSYETKTVHPKIKELQQLGMKEIVRPGYVNAQASPIVRFLQIGVNFIRKKLTNPYAAVFRYQPAIILYNGTCYSIENEQELLRHIRPEHRFFIIGHLNSEGNETLPAPALERVRRAYALCRKVFFVSKRNLQVAEQQLGVTLTNSAIIRNPVNLPDLSVIPYPSLPVTHFATIGNLSVIHKGQDLLLRALAAPVWRNRNWVLNIYGTGIDAGMLAGLASDLGIADKVVLRGHTNDIRKVWQNNHLLLLPSRLEGMPLVVVEAMLCGRTCVATDVGGISEWVEDGVTGFIAPKAATADFEQALERAWQQRQHWPAMGIAARNQALRLYDPHAGATLLDLLITTTDDR